MGSLEELEGRVSALEVQMRGVRQDAAAARVLAGGADRDVSALAARLDAQTRLMEALRETQIEDHQHIAELRRGLARFEQRFDGLERGQGMILDLLRRRNGEEPPASAE
jgi:chromosome segregation ATPase